MRRRTETRGRSRPSILRLQPEPSAASRPTLAKSYVYDVVGPDDAVNSLALEQLANKLFGIVGGVSTGFLLAVFGGVGAFAAMAVTYFFSALLLAAIPRLAPGTGARRAPGSTPTTRNTCPTNPTYS